MNKNFLLVVFILYISCRSSINEHIVNCNKVEVGMTEDEVFKIMGPPKKRSKMRPFDGNTYYILHYDMPAMASTGVSIYFDSTSQKVEKIFCGE